MCGVEDRNEHMFSFGSFKLQKNCSLLNIIKNSQILICASPTATAGLSLV